MNSTRIASWASLVAAIAALNYYSRIDGSSAGSGRSEVYSWSSFVAGLLVYAVWFGLVLAISAERRDLLALRRPRLGWLRAGRYGLAAIGAIVVTGLLVRLLPLPQSPSSEQGLTPTAWEPRHAAAFAANLVLFAVVAPFVEESMFRGVGQSLLMPIGRWFAILVVGVAFGASHGLVEGLLVLVPFGIFLAYVRDRTDSTLPGMVVHGLWNGTVLILSVL